MNFVKYLMANPQIVDELLSELDGIAQEYNHYDYGLPIFNDEEKEKMQVAVQKWVNGLQAVKRPTKRVPDAGESAASTSILQASSESASEGLA